MSLAIVESLFMLYQQIQQRARPIRPGSASGPEGRAETGLPAALLAGSLLVLHLVAPVARGDTASQPMTTPQAAKVIEPIPAPHHPREKTYMKRKWGVEILFLRESVAGYMLEFRYKVLDPGKAAPLFVRKTKPVLTHVRTGKRLTVVEPATTGALRNSYTPLADHTYWMFFTNPNKLIKSGDRVNLQIGDFAVEGLVVM
jgi:hypothetical protein